MDTLRLLKIGLFLARRVPHPLLRTICYPLATAGYLFYGYDRRLIVAHQRRVLGAAGTTRLHWQAWRVLLNTMRNYYALVRLFALDDETILGLVELRGAEHLAAARAAGHGAIVMGAHLGNYNFLAPFMALYTAPAGAFVEPLEPPTLFDFVSAARAGTGLQLVSADREGVRAAMRLLRANGVLALTGDRILGGNGVEVPFFGHPAMLPQGPIVLAQRTGAPLLPATLHNLPGGRYLIELRPPLPLANTGRARADLAANMRLVAAAMEETIAAAPDQWIMLDPLWVEELAPGAPAAKAGAPTAARWWLAAATLLAGLGAFWRRRRRTQD